jgi:hypothetical protein
MKKIFKTIFVCAFLTAIILPSCKKYEEGPLISFRSAKNRLYGDYTLTKYTIDGIDSLQQMKDRFGLSFHFHYQDYYKEDRLTIDGPGISNTFLSIYTLINNNKCINVRYGLKMLTGQIAGFQELDFTILKLKNKDIHLKTSFNNKEYYMELDQ